MKNTGIIRHVDELGRLVLPMELRRKLNIANYDQMEIYVDADRIILRKFVPSCIFCGSDDNLRLYRDKKVCTDCLADLGRGV